MCGLLKATWLISGREETQSHLFKSRIFFHQTTAISETGLSELWQEFQPALASLLVNPSGRILSLELVRGVNINQQIQDSENLL